MTSLCLDIWRTVVEQFSPDDAIHMARLQQVSKFFQKVCMHFLTHNKFVPPLQIKSRRQLEEIDYKTHGDFHFEEEVKSGFIDLSQRWGADSNSDYEDFYQDTVFDTEYETKYHYYKIRFGTICEHVARGDNHLDVTYVVLRKGRSTNLATIYISLCGSSPDGPSPDGPSPDDILEAEYSESNSNMEYEFIIDPARNECMIVGAIISEKYIADDGLPAKQYKVMFDRDTTDHINATASIEKLDDIPSGSLMLDPEIDSLIFNELLESAARNREFMLGEIQCMRNRFSQVEQILTSRAS